jgi:hypothetical protein
MTRDIIVSRRCMVGLNGYFRPGVGPAEGRRRRVLRPEGDAGSSVRCCDLSILSPDCAVGIRRPVHRRNKIIHHNDSASDITTGDIRRWKTEFVEYMRAIDSAVEAAFPVP